jgi:hypothetical protein
MGAYRLVMVALLALALAGCRQQMADQPAYRPLQESDFFPDGRAARPLVPGTVAQGQLADDTAYATGRRANGEDAEPHWFLTAFGFPAGEAFTPESFVQDFPVLVDQALLARGKERYTIFCALCHDRLGTGDGKIVQRGFTRPPSLLDDLSRGFRLRDIDLPLREAPPGYLFEVISKGYGAMPDYSAQVPVHDRWAVVAYVRALQISGRPDAEGPRKGEKP